jgi:hypothetical protein
LKIVSFVLLIISFLSAKQFGYYGSIDFIYDSNVGQNSYEESDYYFVPKIGADYDFEKVPLFVYTDLIYDFYVNERDFDDNSPFLEAGFGTKLKKGKFRYTPSLSYELYLANRVYNPTDRETINSWEPVFHLYSLKNSIRVKKRKQTAKLFTEIAYHNYGETVLDTISYKSKYEGTYLTIAPEYKRNWKVKKKHKVRLKEISAKFDYKHAFLEKKEDSYNLWTLSAYADMKIIYPFLSCKISYGEKYYLDSETHPISGENVWGEKQYFRITPKISVPIISDLSLELGSKIRYKWSNMFGHTYDRYVFSAGILWDSGF